MVGELAVFFSTICRCIYPLQVYSFANFTPLLSIYIHICSTEDALKESRDDVGSQETRARDEDAVIQEASLQDSHEQVSHQRIPSIFFKGSIFHLNP